MAFIGVLPENPSVGRQLASSVGQGLGQGLSMASQLAGQSMLERMKQQQSLELLQRARGKGNAQAQLPEQMKESFLRDLPAIEEQLGRDLTPQDLDHLWKGYQSLQQSQGQQQEESPFEEAYLMSALGMEGPARIATEEAKMRQKEKLYEREKEFLPKKEYIQHAAKENIGFLDEVSQIEKDLPTTEFSLSMIEDSLGDAGKWAAARDFMAEKTGYAGFRSAAGAELDSAIKNYFLGDLTSIKGGRPNVFIEKQIRDAYMRAGQDPISNQKILLGMRMKEKINNLLVEETRRLEENFLKKDGYLPSGFKAMVRKSIRPEVDKIEKDSINVLHNMSKIEESRNKIFRSYLNPGETLMMDQNGSPFAVKNKDVSSYRERGFIPMGKK